MLHHMLRAAAQRAFATLDPYFNYVTMLLHGDGTNGAQNNTFLDSSTNNFTITRNGNTTQGTFTPYGSNWSNYFDGSSYLQVAYNAALDASTGPFTYEAWLNPNTTTNKQYLGGSVTNAFFAFIGSGTIFVGRNNVAVDFTSSATIVTNQWNHVVIVRNSSNNIAIFINGASAYYNASNTNNYGLASNSLRIGVATTGSSYEYAGYISNVRISKSALYDPTASTITVPTAPLTNTSAALLTCQSNRFIDNSSNAFAITTSGSPSVQRFSPFAPATAYSTSVIGGSGYFDGSGDYLSAANNAALQWSTGDFCVEAWIYPNSVSGSKAIICKGTNDTGTFDLGLYGAKIELYTTALVFSSSASLTANTWTHVAVTRSGTTLRCFINGALDTTVTSSYNFNNAGTFYVGVYGSASVNYFNGYMSNVRCVKGSAVYTSAFTPSTTPLTAISGTSLLLGMTNGAIFDNAMMNDLETVGNAQISTSVKKYGTGSMAFDGTGDYLTSPISSTLAFGSGDFTVECWVYATNTSALRNIIGNYNGAVSTASFVFQMESTGRITGGIYSGSSFVGPTSTASISATTWTHLALVRNGTSIKLYINGTNDGSTTSSSVANTPVGIFSVGAEQGSYGWNGYIDDLRITKGVARYTANFTAPTAAFPNN